MNAKVILEPETRAKLLNPILSPMKKRELRQELVKDSIRRAVGGVRTKQELIAAAGYQPNRSSSEYANGLNLITSMIKRRIISHNPTNQFKKRWAVLEDVKITPPSITESVIPKEITLALQPQEDVNKVKLVDMAKDFAWRENSDSLRDFISYMEKAVK